MPDSIAEDALALHGGEAGVVRAEEVVPGLAVVLATAGLVRPVHAVHLAVAAHVVRQALAVRTGKLVGFANRD